MRKNLSTQRYNIIFSPPNFYRLIFNIFTEKIPKRSATLILLTHYSEFSEHSEHSEFSECSDLSDLSSTISRLKKSPKTIKTVVKSKNLHYLCPANARMAESVDALVSNTSGATHPGSSPGPGTQKGEHHHYDALLFFIPARSGTPPYSAPVISMLARYPAPVPLVLLLKKQKIRKHRLLPDSCGFFVLSYLDSNQDRQNQKLQCYHYTIRQSCSLKHIKSLKRHKVRYLSPIMQIF